MVPSFRSISLALCGLAVPAMANNCACLNWKEVHTELDALDITSAGWEVITQAGKNMYAGLDANMCLLRHAQCVDDDWGSNMAPNLATWCFVSSSCPAATGDVAPGTSISWKTCKKDDTKFSELSPSELVAFNGPVFDTDIADPTKFAAWACPYSPSESLDAIVATTQTVHRDGCGFNSENQPNITSMPCPTVQSADGCGGSDDWVTNIQPREQKAALSQAKARLLRKVDPSGNTRVVPAGLGTGTVMTEGTCERPFSLYVIGHGQIYYCAQDGPKQCECEEGCR